jgi:hypothetical protein
LAMTPRGVRERRMVNATNTTETCFIPSPRIHNVLQESLKSTPNVGERIEI